MSDRLTKYYPYCDCFVNQDNDDNTKEFCQKMCDEFQDNCPFKRMADKLAQYEDLEEQGKLTELQWIPCSERLPNKGEMILFQCKNGDMFVGKYKGLDSYNKEIWSTYGAKGRVMNGRKGIAWISLPEPFKEVDYK